MADAKTRGEIKRDAHRLAGVYPVNGELPTDPFLVNDELDAVVGIFSRFADTHYLTYTQDLISGTATYCLPDLKNLTEGGCQVLDSAGKLYQLSLTDVRGAYATAPGYLNAPAPPTQTTDRVPSALVLQGYEFFTLYPTPNYSKTAGIILRGFGVLSASTWANDTDLCPLPARNHIGVTYGLAERIAESMGDDRKAAIMRQRFRYQKGHYESELNTFTESLRHKTEGAYFRIPSGPLNI